MAGDIAAKRRGVQLQSLLMGAVNVVEGRAVREVKTPPWSVPVTDVHSIKKGTR